MFNVADIWEYDTGMQGTKHYFLLLQNNGTPPHWTSINLSTGKTSSIFIVKTETGRFRWKKVA
jgi:hypothetical protein